MFKHTYILLIGLYLFFACGTTKHVPKGRYLLKKNKVVFQNKDLNGDEIKELIRQQPNTKSLKVFKTKLWFFNHVDSARVANKRMRLNRKLREVNSRKKRREEKINRRRIERAKAKNKKLYTAKVIPLKDTLEPKLFFREWLKYKVGEVPVVFDSLLFDKSLDQINAYLKRKGYLYGKVDGKVVYTKHKARVTYYLTENKLYVIDSVVLKTSNETLKNSYAVFLKKNPENNLVGKPLDKDYLEDYRYKLAKYMKNDALYGFSPSHVLFKADTIKIKDKLILEMAFTDRLVRLEEGSDSMVPKRHAITTVNKVYFHIPDTSYYTGNFKQKIDELGLTLMDGKNLQTIDTFVFRSMMHKNSEEFDPKREVTFYYNGTLFLDPGLLEAQNFLEQGNYYKEKYLDRSYSYIQQLGLFQSVKVEIIELTGTNKIDVHYYLIPVKRQSFSFIPRWSNSNGFMGVSASANYTNNNLFKGAEKLTLALSGGFESQPAVFEKDEEGKLIELTARSFNTFEIGPSMKWEVPGLFPIAATKYYKRQRARTVMSAAYNFQHRSDFTREIFQMNYLWKFLSPNRTQVFQVGLPFLSVIKFVNINKSEDFQDQLNKLNDLFLKNTYSDQFIWQDLKFTFEYKNTEKENRKRATVYFSSSFDIAGNTLSLFRSMQDSSAEGQYKLLGLVYSQFIRMDNQFIISHPVGKEKSIHFKALLGGGLPYGNTNTSMPYDYSFFAGGANDNRGWRARTLGPGGYKYYLDTNLIPTQVADLRIGGSAELRISMGSLLKGAIFLDGGNIWTINEDVNRPGSQFTSKWIQQLALAGGFGFRMDFDFFIVRLDIGVPLRNPALPKGGNWIFQSRKLYLDEVNALKDANGLPLSDATKALLSYRLFTPTFNIGIGYPF